MLPTSSPAAPSPLTETLAKVPTGRAVWAIVLGIMSFFVAQVLVMVPLSPVLATNEYLGLLLATILYNVLVIASVWAIIRFLLKGSPRTYGLGGPVLTPLWAVAAFVVPLACIGLITLVTPGSWQAPGTSWEPVGTVVGLIIYVGMFGSIVEEVVFHGLMYPLMKKWLSPWWSAVVTGVVFAVAHMTNGGWTPLSAACFMFTATAIAVYFAYVVEQSGSVWSAAWGHVVWNLVLNVTSIAAAPSDRALLNYVVTDDNPLLTGGDGGFGDSLISAVVVLACAGLVMWRGRRREDRVPAV